MEIIGRVVKITDTYIRLRTSRKKQLIDLFYPESKRVSLKWIFEPKVLARIEVEAESFEMCGCKFAKLWLKFVIWPEYSKPESIREEGVRIIFEERKKLYRKIPE